MTNKTHKTHGRRGNNHLAAILLFRHSGCVVRHSFVIRLALVILLTSFVLVAMVGSNAILAADSLHVGMAETLITPPEGYLMAGYYHERRATGALDPLKSKAVVFRSGQDAAALAVCDLTGIAVDLSHEVRRRVAARTGIPAEHVVIAATHSHTAPDYSKDLYDTLGANRAGSEPAGTYAGQLIAAIVESIELAAKNAQPSVIESGSAIQAEPVSFNRRFLMKDGSVRTWMKLDSPGVVRAAGPIDPEIGLIHIRSIEGNRSLGVISNFALHLDTVGGTQWSGDYPAQIEQVLRRSLGPDLVSLFGNGCCGDINHSDPARAERNKTDYIGQSLGRTIEAGLPSLQQVAQPLLRVRRETVTLPLQEVTAEQIAAALPLVTEARAGNKVEFFSLVTAYKSLILDQLRNAQPHARPTDYLTWGLSHDWSGVGATLPVEVHVLALGTDVAIVALPGEIFVDLGLAIKRASPFRTTLIIELSNCVETIYVPHRAAYAGGSYEVTNSTTQPGSGEMLVEAAVRMLREIASSGAE